MSSRKSRKTRSRTKTKPQGPNSYGPAEDDEQSAPFLPMLAGMTVSLMLVFWVIGLLTAKQSPKDTTSPADQYTIAALETTNFDQFLQDADPDQLIARLNTIKSSKSKPLSPERVEENNQRIAICQKLLSANTSQQYKTYAKLDWLDAQKSNYGIDFIGKMKSTQVADVFKKCYTQFLNDTDARVYREAHLAQISYHLFESIKGEQPVDAVSKYLNETLEKFPQDDHVSATIRLQFKACVESDIELAKQLADDVLRSDRTQSGLASEFAQFVLDSYQIIKIKYDDMIINRFVNGDAGLRELEKASIMLLDNPESGDLILDRVSEVAFWFERQHLLHQATQIFKAMIKASQHTRKIKSTKERLSKIGNAGMTRIKLMGNHLPISGTTLAGQTIEDGDFSGRIVLGIFFDPDKEKSMKLLRKIERSAKRYAEFGSPIRIVGVPATPADFSKQLASGIENSRVHFLGWKGEQPPDLANLYPVNDFPHLFALDQKGLLRHINLDPDRYETEIEFLVDQR
jgi:hypothetical protein